MQSRDRPVLAPEHDPIFRVIGLVDVTPVSESRAMIVLSLRDEATRNPSLATRETTSIGIGMYDNLIQ